MFGALQARPPNRLPGMRVRVDEFKYQVTEGQLDVEGEFVSRHTWQNLAATTAELTQTSTEKTLSLQVSRFGCWSTSRWRGPHPALRSGDGSGVLSLVGAG
jgi:hypothetical protein